MQIHRRLRVSLLALLLAVPIGGQAVTLGEARIKSYLNQPMDAEIDLVGVRPGEHQDLRLRIANQADFDRLGIQYTPFIADLSFDIVQVGGRWLARIRSTRPANEPFLDFPLLLSWPGGQMVKQVTFLLDPPRGLNPPTRASTATPAAAAPVRALVPRAADSPTRDSYGPVRRGETLWPIAQRLKPRGITTQQMAMALLRANPEAFINGNINQLLEGAVLFVPPLDFIQQLDAATARRDFNAAARQAPVRVATAEPSRPVARTTGAAPDKPEGDAGQAPAAPPSAKPDEDAQLRIVADDKKSAAEPGSEADLEKKLLVTMEEIESNRLTTSAIESRVSKLEAELTRMQQLLDLKDEQIRVLQSEVAAQEQAGIETGSPSSASADLDRSAQVPQEQQPSSPTSAKRESTPAASTPSVRSEAATPVAGKRGSIAHWYQEYLWLLWLALALLGGAALLLMFRRPQPATADEQPLPAPVPAAARAAAGSAATTAAAAVAAAPEPEPSALRDAEADLRAVADAHMPEDDLEELDLPEIDINSLTEISDEFEVRDDVTDSMLAEMLEESKLLSDRPTPGADKADFNDEDIASWIRELGNEGDVASADTEELAPSEQVYEIPDVVTELDDQLMTPASTDAGPDIPLIDLPDEDDTFTMSLDLARAYLEIGDQDGARDMLQQALSGARDPDHRRQIEELLQQIT